MPAQSPAQPDLNLPFYRATAINLTPASVNFIIIGSITYYVGYDPQHGAELWKTDGTDAGTMIVADINPGIAGSQPSNFCNAGGVLFFSADDGVHGAELWKSDGTTAGTMMVKDIYAGSAGSGIVNINALPNGVVIFQASDGTNSRVTWRSDGTAAGTYMLVNDRPNYFSPNQFTVVGSNMFFVSGSGFRNLIVTDGTNAGTLTLTSGDNPEDLISYNGKLYYRPFFPADSNIFWQSDGTVAGTVGVASFGAGFSANTNGIYKINGKLLVEFYSSGFSIGVSDGTTPGSIVIKSNASLASSPIDFAGFSLMFLNDGAAPHGDALWKTDGTSIGTIEVKDFNSSVTTDTLTDALSGASTGIVKVGSQIFFGYDDKINGHQLWSSDGTAGGTVLVKNISGSSLTSNLYQFTAFGSQLIFTAQDSLGTELWTSDGTSAGTTLVKDLLPGAGSSQPKILSPFAGKLLFAAANPSVGAPTLYLTDGTSNGTSALKKARVAAQGITFNSSPPITTLNNQIFFSGNDHFYGTQLWKSDATSTGAILNANMLVDFLPNGTCATVSNLTTINGSLFFTVHELTYATGNSGSGEPWFSDGTTAGTQILKDIYPGPIASNATGFTKLNNKLFFSASDGVNGTELWVTDGTTAGTVMVKDINPGAASSSPSNFMVVGSLLVFTATTVANGTELWVSDGTSAGTQILNDINPGATSTSFASFTNTGSKVFFSANDGVNGAELWVTDGTPAGTLLVQDIYPGASGSNPSSMMALNATTVVFQAYTPATGYELFISDGTGAGTSILKDIISGAGSSSPTPMAKVGSKIVFSVNDGVDGVELWVTDGTPAGTFLLKDINPGAASSTPIFLAMYNNQMIFKATDAVNKTQIWATDGTPSGTIMLTSFNTAYTGISTDNFIPTIIYKSKLYFPMNDGTHGTELWTTDGTPQGTSMLYDLSPGSRSSNPTGFQIMGNHLFYFANLDDRGTQLLMIP